MTEENNISRIPSVADREYFRVTGQLYMFSEPVEMDKGGAQERKGFFIPTFVQDEDDFAGLSIDAFRETLLIEDIKDKDYFLKVQQLLSMMKRFVDAELLGRKQKLYKKVQVNISGSGLSFPSDVAYHTEQQLRVSLFFPRFPYTSLSLVCDVVRSEKAEIGYEIKVKFSDISESSREEVLKFVNQCQRDNIRKEEE